MKPVYAKLNESTQQIGGSKPNGWIEMTEQRPSPQHIAKEDGTWFHDSQSINLKKIAAKRYEKEIEGVVYSNIRWTGDKDGRQAVTEAIDAAERFEQEYGAGTWTTTWKGVATTEGGTRWLVGCTLTDLLQVQALGAQRRNDCFLREHELELSVMDGTFVEEDLETGWPE